MQDGLRDLRHLIGECRELGRRARQAVSEAKANWDRTQLAIRELHDIRQRFRAGESGTAGSGTSAC
jgi:hypothetical protein